MIFAGILYYRNQGLAEIPTTVRWGMAFLRFALVSVICLLILGPLLRYLEVDIEPPILALIADDSKSMVMVGDSVTSANSVNATKDDLVKALSEAYEIETYSFGSELKERSELTFNEPETDISAALNSIELRYANRNLGAVVLLSDGISNKGLNPRYSISNLPAPVYTVAFGDTTVHRDAKIAEVASNDLAYLGNTFPIEVRVSASKMTGASGILRVLDGDRVLFEEQVDYDSENYSNTFRTLIEANESGLKRYTVTLSVDEEESNPRNNVASVIIEVIDGRQKILLLAHSPHPDVKAIRESINANPNYEVDVFLDREFQGDLDDYDLLILHQLPSRVSSGRRLKTQLENNSIPKLLIMGRKSVVGDLPALGSGVEFLGRARSTNDVKGEVNDDFSIFELSPELSTLLNVSPPLQVPFGEWNISNSAEVLLYQSVGKITTTEPLLVLNSYSENKVATLLGEGIWRWRMTDFAINENHDRFDAFMGSLVQYLSLKEDKRLFRVEGPGTIMENQPIRFRAELYNPSYEQVNDVEVNLIVEDEEGNEFPFTFSKTPGAYQLEIGALPPGNYSYNAFVSRGGEKYEAFGSFPIKPFTLESSGLLANHKLLNVLSENSSGKMYYPESTKSLSDYLLSEESSIKPVSYSTEVFDTILNLKWLFWILLILLSGEWFLRKYYGRY